MGIDAPLRRVITWCTILAYVAVASGLPLPWGSPAAREARPDPVGTARLHAKDRSTPFPCMDKPCGCATAEQCFANCCCNTPAETLAWARAHGVKPALLAALERRAGRERAKPSASCCGTTAARSCCEPEPEAACCRVAPPAASTEPQGESLRSAPRFHGVVLRAMLACGGLVEQWVASAGSMPPEHVTWSANGLPCGRLAAMQERPIATLSPLEPPPPRAA